MAYVHNYLNSCKLGDIRECISRGDGGSSSDIKYVVRRYALNLGYHRQEFYVDDVGSCELLLFFAWLLQATPLTSQLQCYHVQSALRVTSIPLASSKHFLLEHVVSHTLSLEKEVQTLITHDQSLLEDPLRRVEWLRGVLRGSCRSTENAHRAAVKLSHNIHQSCTKLSSQTTNKQPLSLHNVFLLRYPEQLSVCMKRLEWHTTSLDSLAKWRQHEPVFWQWMESVLDQRTSLQCAAQEEGGSGDAAQLTLSTATLEEEVIQCQQKLNDVISEKRVQITRLKKVQTSRGSTYVTREDSSPVLGVQPVAVESSVFLPQSAHLQANHCLHGGSVQYRTVESELSRLQANIQKSEEQLHSLKAALCRCIPS